MLYAGLDLSRKRLDVCVLDAAGERVLEIGVSPTLMPCARSPHASPACGREPVSAAIESMTGARFVHDTLERLGWEVDIADAQRAKGLAPLVAKTDRIDAWVLAELARRGWCRPSGCPTQRCAARVSGPLPGPPGPPSHGAQEPDPRDPHELRPPGAGERPVRRRRPAAAQRPGAARAMGRRPSPPAASSSTSSTGASVAIDLELRAERQHPYVALLRTIPGVGPVLAATIAAELGDVDRFRSAKALVGYTGLVPFVVQSGERDRRGPLTKHGPRYLRWALIEAAIHAAAIRPIAALRRTRRRLGRQRGPRVARVEVARGLATAIWHMLTTGAPSRRQVPRIYLVA